MKIVSGDWRRGGSVGVRSSEAETICSLIFPVSKFSFEEIPISKIKLIAEVTTANQTTLGTSLDWGIDAAVILGALENVTRGLGCEDAGNRLLVIQLFDGRKILIAGDDEEIGRLKAIQYLPAYQVNIPLKNKSLDHASGPASLRGVTMTEGEYHLPSHPFTQPRRQSASQKTGSLGFGKRGR